MYKFTPTSIFSIFNFNVVPSTLPKPRPPSNDNKPFLQNQQQDLPPAVPSDDPFYIFDAPRWHDFSVNDSNDNADAWFDTHQDTPVKNTVAGSFPHEIVEETPCKRKRAIVEESSETPCKRKRAIVEESSETPCKRKREIEEESPETPSKRKQGIVKESSETPSKRKCEIAEELNESETSIYNEILNPHRVPIRFALHSPTKVIMLLVPGAGIMPKPVERNPKKKRKVSRASRK
ncbi:8206_t:CDS:2 [Ambispora gerdemannii]|uniref:8206_t:CDS:1 n=1 Tax=Ambispora gerdemannii TaxID=144530 RepID=A0A9N8ZTC1_9GLOM|nr:8206_t:CDS:2 [Ambispora gerdemannii]